MCRRASTFITLGLAAGLAVVWRRLVASEAERWRLEGELALAQAVPAPARAVSVPATVPPPEPARDLAAEWEAAVPPMDS